MLCMVALLQVLPKQHPVCPLKVTCRGTTGRAVALGLMHVLSLSRGFTLTLTDTIASWWGMKGRAKVLPL